MTDSPQREFLDGDGRQWLATVRERPGTDYKGRYYFFVRPAESAEGDGFPEQGFPLGDVRWNSLRTAERTLSTMSDVELRRRLRSASNRAKAPTPSDG